MKRPKGFHPRRRGDFLSLFSKIDTALKQEGQKADVILLGGASVVLLGFRERATGDIDIVAGASAGLFCKTAEGIGIPTDVVTVSSTVDFEEAPKTIVFQGKNLTVRSIKAEELIKLKLERFRKQDPEDIYAILEKSKISFDQFVSLVKQMLPDFVGNPKTVILSAQIVVEHLYPENVNFLAKLSD